MEPMMLDVWQYGGTFAITFDAKDDKVYKVKSTGKNGLKIPMPKLMRASSLPSWPMMRCIGYLHGS